MVLGAADLLLHHRPLAVDLLLVEAGVNQHVGQHVHRQLQTVERDLVPIAGYLLGGVGVQDAARSLDRLRDVDRRGALLGALEHHMLQEVCQTLRALALAA